MKKLLFVLILLPSQSFSGAVSPSAETESNADIPSLLDTIIIVNTICGSKDQCNGICCQLYKYYSFAKINCTAGEHVDKQLAKLDLKWYAPFSTIRKVCEPICFENFSDYVEKTSEKTFQAFDNDTTSTLKESGPDLCNNFIDFCYKYSFDNLDELMENVTEDENWEFWLPVSILGFSISLMSLTLFIYLAIPQVRCRVQDKCFLFHLGSRTVVMCIHLTVAFFPRENTYCILIGFLHQFFGLASSFWLNVICFHLWRSFRSKIPPRQSDTDELIPHYSLYAWGCSLLVTCATHLADHCLPKDSSLRPKIQINCIIKNYDDPQGSSIWFQPMFVYYYSITIALQIINLCAFFHVAYIISKKNGNLRIHKKKRIGLITYLKLFLLMGFIRILDIVLYHLGISNITKTTECFLNAVFIFLIFVYNERVLRLIRKQFPKRTASQLTVKYST